LSGESSGVHVTLNATVLSRGTAVHPRRGIAWHVICTGAAALLGCAPAASAHACIPPGVWSVPVPGGVREIGAREIFLQARTQPVVLLGESHDNAEHHRWQLHTLV